MVTDAAILEAVGEVVDPEVPVLTIADLGVLRGVRHEGDEVVVTITPTYSGCPAMDLIRHEVELTLQALHVHGRVETVLSPPWTTDWMTEAGKAKLTDYGIAPPPGTSAPAPFPPSQSRANAPVLLQLSIRCPLCGSPNTSELSRFGSTSCKSLWRCNSCREPFDHFKAI
ncbi:MULTISPECIES: 1,2-phenylacetyl-CoA epoxidase subunit PaaD [Kribbella]|uniref:Ring-1,2-phenylacetyl-CoA epoxidase subunit PaaD n=1 Tax=Kribbella pratensis TaxID=2512112 RepID=A0ABY2FME6_9ACTN|nr:MULTISPECIES: 1,2-phenylacetyl-CoA epoxidase subunit PaaD [Kribbella]TDW93969.1 ring-1,2-phenylacetyl-CoA epoxidase subunit PaaD [Kribbella pratensis]TDX02578.1 ring-1,2-phenylacetyl-CoA epoxidase subunit PaaD [Kribbella sp. VKM Ac-2566]